MIKFKNINGDVFLAVGSIKRKSALNGEKSLSGTLFEGDDVLNKIDKGWSLEFGNEPYVVTYFERNDNDNTVEFDAIHKFFWDMSKDVLYFSWSGSHTVKAYLDQIFNGTGYTYALNFEPSAFEKENWGMKNKLSLFNDVIDSMGGEFEINGTLVSIFKNVGSDVSTIVRHGFNLSDMSLENDNTDFVTYGEGFGAYADQENQTGERLHVTYTSPLAKTFGKLHAEPIDDQRYTIKDNLLQAIKDKVDGSFAISIKLSLYDLTAAGYPYKMANVGDWLLAIDENLDFKQKIRIISVDDEFATDGTRISYTVTCGDIGVVQKYQQANASLGQKVDSAYQNAQDAKESSIQAVIAANGKNTNYYVDGVENLPTTANEGDIAFVQTGDGQAMYIWTKMPDGSFKWVKRVDPDTGEQIAAGVDSAIETAKSQAAQMDAVRASEAAVFQSEANTALSSAAAERAAFFSNATSIANSASAHADTVASSAAAYAKAEAASALSEANDALTAAKSDLTTSIEQEIADRNEAVQTVNSQAQSYINQAKSDITDTINAISVGSRNLLLGTSDWSGGSARWNQRGTVTTDTYRGMIVASASSAWRSPVYTIQNAGILQVGNTYTFSTYVRNTSDTDTKVTAYYDAGHTWLNAYIVPLPAHTDWTRVSTTFKVTKDPTTSPYGLRWEAQNDVTNGQVQFAGYKLETGNVATDWTPAPEDVVLDYTTKDNQIKATITQYKDTNDGKVTKAQTDATTALGLVATKVSQTDYDKKTGDLTTKYTQVKQTADSQATDIASIKSEADSQSAQINDIVSDAKGTKQTVSDLKTEQGKQSGSIATLQSRADGFDATVTKVNNLSVGSRNLLLGTGSWVGDSTRWSQLDTVTNNTYRGTVIASTSKAWYSPTYLVQNAGILQVGKAYTFSTYVRNTSDTDTSIGSYYDYAIVTPNGRDYTIPLPAHTDWTRVSITFKVIKDPTTSTAGLRWVAQDALTNGALQLVGYKLEEGNVPTDWTPAPEDVDSATAIAQLTADQATLSINNYKTDADGRISKAQSDATTAIQTAQGAQTTVTSVQKDVKDLQSKTEQTAGQVSTEIEDRKNGDKSVVTQMTGLIDQRITDTKKGYDSAISQSADTIMASVSMPNKLFNTDFSPDLEGWDIYKPDNGNVYRSYIYNASNAVGFNTRNATDGHYGVIEQFVTPPNTIDSNAVISMRWNVRTAEKGDTTFLFIAFIDKNGSEIYEQHVDWSADNVGGDKEEHKFENIAIPQGTESIKVSFQVAKGNLQYLWKPMLVFNSSAPLSYMPGSYSGMNTSTVFTLTNTFFGLNIMDHTGDVISGINADTSGVTITGKQITLDGNTTVTGDFYAKGGNFKNLNASNITTGTINAANINVINLDVSSLSGNITNFIKSYWNAAYSNVEITGSGMTVSTSGIRTTFDSTGAHYANGSTTAQYQFVNWKDDSGNMTNALGLNYGLVGTSNSYVSLVGSGSGSVMLYANQDMNYGSNSNIVKGRMNMFAPLNIRNKIEFMANPTVQSTYITADERRRTLNFYTNNAKDGIGNYFWFNHNVLSEGTFNGASLLSKKNIKSNFDTDALSEISKTQLVNFEYKNNIGENHVSPIIDDINDTKQYYIPEAVLSEDKKHVDMYSMISMAWKAIQQLDERTRK